MPIYDEEKEKANLKAFREQAVEDGYFSGMGALRRYEGTLCIAIDGGMHEFYDDGRNSMTFKQIGGAGSFKVYVVDLPYPEYHN